MLGGLLGDIERQSLEFASLELDAEPLANPFREARRAVVVGEEPLDGGGDLLVDHVEHRVLRRRPFEKPLAERVDPLPLLVHHLIVFEQILTRVEVPFLDLLLGSLDPSRDELAFDRLVLFHAETGEHGRNPFAGELPHQVVFERQEEARRTRVALASRPSSELVINSAAFVPLGADDVQPSGRGDLAPLDLHPRLVLGDRLFPNFLGNFEAGRIQRPAVFIIEPLEVGPGHELGVAAEDDVGSASRHVRGDRNGPLASRLRHDFGFAFVILSVQHLVRDAMALENLGDLFRLLDRGRSDENRPASGVDFAEFFEDRVIFLAVGPVDDVGIADARHSAVCRNRHDIELVDLPELVGLGHGRSGHARQFLVELEEVLERDRGESLILLLDLDPFLGLDRLVKTVGPLTAGHQAPGELIDDHDLAVLIDVVAVALVEVVRLQRVVDQVGPLHVTGSVETLDPGDFLGLADALVVEVAGSLLLLDFEVNSRSKQSGDSVGLGVFADVVERRPRDDQRRSRLVDQDAVDFVDDRVVQAALRLLLDVRLHVVAQVVETEFVVGAVSDVPAVDFLSFGRIHFGLDRADGHA